MTTTSELREAVLRYRGSPRGGARRSAPTHPPVDWRLAGALLGGVAIMYAAVGYGVYLTISAFS